MMWQSLLQGWWTKWTTFATFPILKSPQFWGHQEYTCVSFKLCTWFVNNSRFEIDIIVQGCPDRAGKGEESNSICEQCRCSAFPATDNLNPPTLRSATTPTPITPPTTSPPPPLAKVRGAVITSDGLVKWSLGQSQQSQQARWFGTSVPVVIPTIFSDFAIRGKNQIPSHPCLSQSSKSSRSVVTFNRFSLSSLFQTPL